MWCSPPTWIRPPGQKANLFLLASKFPALGSEQQLTTTFERALDQALASTGLRHGDLSWVGDQVAFVLDAPASIGVGASPKYAVLIDTKDEGAAKTTLQKLQDSPAASGFASDARWTNSTIDGVDVSSNDQGAYAVFDGTVVIASSLDEMSAIISTAHGHQAALDGSELAPGGDRRASRRQAGAALRQPDGHLLPAQPGAGPSTTSPGLSSLEAITGFAMTVSAQPDGVALDVQVVDDPSKLTDEQKAQMNEPGHPNPLLSSIPSDALAVITGEQLDTSLKMVADQLATTSPEAARMLEKLGVSGDAGLISALSGDDAIEVAPNGAGSAPGGALILGTKDPAAMQSALDKLSKGLSSLAESQSQSFSAIGRGPLPRPFGDR